MVSKKLNVLYKLNNGMIVYSLVTTSKSIMMKVLNYNFDEVMMDTVNFAPRGTKAYNFGGQPSFTNFVGFEIKDCIGTFNEFPEYFYKENYEIKITI